MRPRRRHAPPRSSGHIPRLPPPTSFSRIRAARATRARGRPIPAGRWREAVLRESARRCPPDRAVAQTAAPSRACCAVRLLTCRLVVRVRRCAFQPDVAAVEMFALPDRHDLLDALDRVSAGGERICPVGRCRRNHDTCLANLQPPEAVMYRNASAGPELVRLVDDTLQRAGGEWLVRLVLEKLHLTPLVVIPDEPGERHHRTVPVG